MMGSVGPEGNAPNGNNTAAQPSPSPTQSPQARAEELKKQAEAYSLILQREPENQTALRGLLEARLGLADVKGAIEPLEKLVKISPQDTRLAVLLAQAKQQNKEPEAAAQVYRNVLQKQPGELNALGGLSALLIDQKRPEAAVSLLKDTLKEATTVNKAAPGSVDTAAVQILLGKVYASEKRYDEAVTSFDTAAKDNPQNFQPVYYKAVLLRDQGKLDEAKSLFEKAASLAPAEVKDQINRDAAGTQPKVEVKSEGEKSETDKPKSTEPPAASDQPTDQPKP
ncbi:tetratricopeptide repeat protein [filamentous cyanobacterium LEGE 11480]|uniref:Tetratricopeptide repeat protein n=2 Tax=Romeriopsis TaxID=2992131 RepID=A0A928VT27_9CYAN|nr:tetratricopeptide repeat protein [Romeriopsis navalis LEGE 11480]